MKSYYNPTAFIRDNDTLDVAQRLIEGVEGIKTFTMPINSSLLNTWPSQSLVWAGIWFPTLKTTPLAPCDDVAMIIEEDSKLQGQEEASDTASLCSAISFGSQTSSLRQVLALSEDEVLKIILAKDDNVELPSSSYATSELEENKKCFDSNMGNSLAREGWSFDESQQEIENRVDKRETEQSANTEMSKSMEGSFTALVENYNMVGGSYIRTPDIKGMWQKFEDERMKESSPSPPQCTVTISQIMCKLWLIQSTLRVLFPSAQVLLDPKYLCPLKCSKLLVKRDSMCKILNARVASLLWMNRITSKFSS